MRCPKCQYISFDNGDSCRNCGYQFSLSVLPEPVDLPMHTGDEPEGPLADLTLDDRRADRTPARGDFPAAIIEAARVTEHPPAASVLELPLFVDRSARGDSPLVSAPAVPRPPLAVRKTAAAIARTATAGSKLAARRSAQPEPVLDLGPPEVISARPRPTRPPALQREIAADSEAPAAAPASLRLLGGAIDVLVLGAIDAVVLHYTLKICGLTYAEIGILPIAPFAAFLLLLNGGYLVGFTAAGGQSIGKMVAGVKIVPADLEHSSDRIPFGQAVLRSAGYLVSALPAGLGFLPALVGADRRAVHDRLAHTRVIKV